MPRDGSGFGSGFEPQGLTRPTAGRMYGPPRYSDLSR